MRSIFALRLVARSCSTATCSPRSMNVLRCVPLHIKHFTEEIRRGYQPARPGTAKKRKRQSQGCEHRSATHPARHHALQCRNSTNLGFPSGQTALCSLQSACPLFQVCGCRFQPGLQGGRKFLYRSREVLGQLHEDPHANPNSFRTLLLQET